MYDFVINILLGKIVTNNLGINVSGNIKKPKPKFLHNSQYQVSFNNLSKKYLKNTIVLQNITRTKAYIIFGQLLHTRITFWDIFNNVIIAVTYPDLFWADWYTHQSHEGTTMVDDEHRNFQNLCLQML